MSWILDRTGVSLVTSRSRRDGKRYWERISRLVATRKESRAKSSLKIPRKQCRGWVEIYLIVESETGRKSGEDGREGKKKEEEWKWHRLSRASLSFSIIRSCSPAVALPLLHPTSVHALLVSLGTLAFYRRTLTFEARGSRWRRRGLRWWKVSTLRGNGGMMKSGDREEKREKGRLFAGWSARAIKSTVGSIKPI